MGFANGFRSLKIKSINWSKTMTIRYPLRNVAKGFFLILKDAGNGLTGYLARTLYKKEVMAYAKIKNPVSRWHVDRVFGNGGRKALDVHLL